MAGRSAGIAKRETTEMQEGWAAIMQMLAEIRTEMEEESAEINADLVQTRINCLEIQVVPKTTRQTAHRGNAY